MSHPAFGPKDRQIVTPELAELEKAYTEQLFMVIVFVGVVGGIIAGVVLILTILVIWMLIIWDLLLAMVFGATAIAMVFVTRDLRSEAIVLLERLATTRATLSGAYVKCGITWPSR